MMIMPAMIYKRHQNHPFNCARLTRRMSPLCFLCFLLSVSPPFTSPTILFQGFNWESCNRKGGWYNFLKERIHDIANAGITHVWLPPPSQSAAPQDTRPKTCEGSGSSLYKNIIGGYASSITRLYMKNTMPDFAVAEKWDSLSNGQDGKPDADQDAHRRKLKDWVQAARGPVPAFDFTTKGILQAAVQGELWRLKDSNGKPPGFIGLLPQNAVTFIENYDTESTRRLWPFPSDKVMLGYAYILTHPGTPSIFYDHLFDWGLKKEIGKLAAIRTRNGINTASISQQK